MNSITEIRCTKCHGNAGVGVKDLKRGSLPCPFCGTVIILPHLPLYVYNASRVQASVVRFEDRWHIRLSHTGGPPQHPTHNADDIEVATQIVKGTRVRTIKYNGKYTQTRREHIYVYRADKSDGETLAVTIEPGDNRPIRIPVDSDAKERWLCNALRYILNELDDRNDETAQHCSNCDAILHGAASAAPIVNCPFCDTAFVTHAAEAKPRRINLPDVQPSNRPLSTDVTVAADASEHRWQIRPAAFRWLAMGLFTAIFRASVSVQLFFIALVATSNLPPGIAPVLLLIQVPLLVLDIGRYVGKAIHLFNQLHHAKWLLRISDNAISVKHTYRGRTETDPTIYLSQLEHIYFTRNESPFIHLIARSPAEEICMPFYLGETDSSVMQYQIVNAMKQHLPAAGRECEP
ncbi:MAG: hypothetical protein JXX14_20915 [Deltaproteobacteria bacterium]|nr:hypothetical protein [Deltaproteobacteria bacterium]